MIRVHYEDEVSVKVDTAHALRRLPDDGGFYYCDLIFVLALKVQFYSNSVFV
jgi:hypothetical protein